MFTNKSRKGYGMIPDFDVWPNCKFQDCENKVNLRFNTGYCFPHTAEKISPSAEYLSVVEESLRNLIELHNEQLLLEERESK